VRPLLPCSRGIALLPTIIPVPSPCPSCAGPGDAGAPGPAGALGVLPGDVHGGHVLRQHAQARQQAHVRDGGPRPPRMPPRPPFPGMCG
jgi:hypothetical protein